MYLLPAGCASLTRYRIGGGVGSQGGLIQVDSQGSHGTLVSQAPIPCLAPLFYPKMTIEVFLLHRINQKPSVEIPGNHRCCFLTYNRILKELIEDLSPSMSLS